MNIKNAIPDGGAKAKSDREDFQAILGDLFKAIPGAVLVWGRDGRIMGVNEEWEKTFGLKSVEVLGLTADDLDAKILNFVAEPHFVRQVLNGARTHPDTHKPGICHILPIDDRSERFLECRVRRVCGGILDGYLIEHYQSIDQLVKADQEQHSLQKTLIRAQKLEIVGVMSAGVFHDLNNVLAIVSGYSQMIRVNPAAAEKYIRKISDSCQLMEHIIKQAMSFATCSEGEFLSVEIAEILDDSLGLLRHCIPKRIELHWEKPENFPKIPGNDTQIFQLMMNLCLNASQAIDEKGTIDVSLSVKDVTEPTPDSEVKPGKYAVLEVVDNGCGMGEKTHNRLFNPFFSKQHHHEGRGLGLYVVQQIITLHNAAIEVTSCPGQGTHVCVYFPLGDESAANNED